MYGVGCPVVAFVDDPIDAALYPETRMQVGSLLARTALSAACWARFHRSFPVTPPTVGRSRGSFMSPYPAMYALPRNSRERRDQRSVKFARVNEPDAP